MIMIRNSLIVMMMMMMMMMVLFHSTYEEFNCARAPLTQTLVADLEKSLRSPGVTSILQRDLWPHARATD